MIQLGDLEREDCFYHDLTYCSWRVLPSDYFDREVKLRMIFDWVDLGEGDMIVLYVDDNPEPVKVVRGPEDGAPGKDLVVEAWGHQLRVFFQSDGEGRGRGFSLRYYANESRPLDIVDIFWILSMSVLFSLLLSCICSKVRSTDITIGTQTHFLLQRKPF